MWAIAARREAARRTLEICSVGIVIEGALMKTARR
jgi:hypothetical protein